MKNEVMSEWIKTKNSPSLYCTILVPCCFFIYTLFSKLSTQNPTGEINNHSIIQITIYNIYTLIFIPLMVILIVYLDYKNEMKNKSFSLIISNHWNEKKIMLAKFINYILLSLLSYIVLTIVVIISNIITTGSSGDMKKIIIANLMIWFLSISLIAINMIILSYFSFVLTYILNMVIVLIFGLKPLFDYSISLLIPWTYGLKIERLAFNIEPNGLLGNTIVISTQMYQLKVMTITNLLIIGAFLLMISIGFKFYTKEVE